LGLFVDARGDGLGQVGFAEHFKFLKGLGGHGGKQTFIVSFELSLERQFAEPQLHSL
jgi:hypothetical protein